MNLLLDTHVLLWWLAGDSRIRKEVINAISDPGNRIWVSAATVWEIGIKERLGKLKVPEPVVESIKEEGFEDLDIKAIHAHEAAMLPVHHRDPFDRMLIAQARLEHLKLVTADQIIFSYDVDALKV